MDRVFLTENPKLVDEIVCEVKSQGVFDQFRRNCIADVDTKPAYQNLRQRVENIVSNFLNEQVWRPDLNKNQLREKLRKHITEAGFLETGVERIVDQVVNPKINSVFLPKIEDISYKYLGIEKPKPSDDQILHSEPCSTEDIKPILPTDLDDLEAVSPDSTGSKKSFKDSTEDLNTSSNLNKSELNDSGEKIDDDFESPAFEPLKNLTGTDSINGEDDSKLSDISGLTSQDSVNSEQQVEIEIKATAPTIEVVEQPAVTQSQQIIPENINQDSVLSQVSSNSHLSIVTDSNNKSSEVDICEEAQMPKFSENSVNNPEVDDKDKKPLLTSFDIKQDEIIFEGTERRSSLHDLNDIRMDEDVVMKQLEDSTRTDSVENLNKTESSSSFMDPIISETKDLSLKDELRSSETEFKFEEPIGCVDITDTSVSVSSQNEKHKVKDSKLERKSDSKSEHKSHRRDKDKSSSSHHSRDKHKDGDRKHSSSSSKHSSGSSSGRKEHRSESRETKKSTSSDHKRDESSKSADRSSVKNLSASHSSSRDKDSNHKSSRSHEDKHNKDREKSDKNRSKHDHDRSSNKSRSQHRDEKSRDEKRRSHDDDGKKKLGHETISKSKSIDDDHAVHHEKHIERRRSTDRDSDDGNPTRGKPTSTNQVDVSSVNASAITNSTSSSSFSSTTSSCTDDHEKREVTTIQRNADPASSSDYDDSFVPTSAPVVVDEILIGNDINLEMLMEKNNMALGEMDPVMSLIQQSLSDDKEIQIKKPKVASNIFEARKLMKVRKQMEREQKKRLEKLLVHTKQIIGTNSVAATKYGIDEQGVELEFSVMSSSAPSISSPIKSKDVEFEGLQAPAPVNEKRNSGEFIIDVKEMEKQLKKKKSEKPTTPKYTHKFDEILSQIDRPKKRESKGSLSPSSPEKSPKFELNQRKFVREQSREISTVVEIKKPTSTTSPPRYQRDEKKIEKSSSGRSQDVNKSRKDSVSSKTSPRPQSPVSKSEQKQKSNKIVSLSAAGSASTSAKHELTKELKISISSKKTVSKANRIDTPNSPNSFKPSKDLSPKTLPTNDDITKVRVEKSVKSNADSDEDSNEFYGFPIENPMYESIIDYAEFCRIIEAKMNVQTLNLMNCDKDTCKTLSKPKATALDDSVDDKSLITEAFQGFSDSVDSQDSSKTGKGSDTKGTKNNVSSKNGVRPTAKTQHKLFIENNQFADNSDGKQISRKRKNSGVPGPTVKIAKLVDSKINCGDIELPTPSEQSKENQIIHQVKKPNRTSDNTCTSEDVDQQTTEKSESNNKPNQRYTSDDLYKPRPILSRTRRRGIENGEI